VVDVNCRQVHLFLSRLGFLERLTAVQRLAALVGAIVHDFRHPGTTNAHEIKVRTPRATLHSDASVLERHHLASAFAVLDEPGHTLLLDVLAPAEYQECRSLIIDMVLHTDLSKHFEFVARLNSLASSKGYRATAAAAAAAAAAPAAAAAEEAEWSSPFIDEDVRLLLISAIKFADLGHVTKPFATHRQWVERLTAELYALGDLERRMGVPISFLADRERDGNVARSQIGFMQVVCMPFFKVLADLACGPGVEPFMNAQENFWQWLAAQNEQKKEHEVSRSSPSCCAAMMRPRSTDDLDSASGIAISTLAHSPAAGRDDRYRDRYGHSGRYGHGGLGRRALVRAASVNKEAGHRALVVSAAW